MEIQKLIQEIGCTTPFTNNQSASICTDPKMAKQAWKIHNELMYENPTEMLKHCPKSCTQVQPRFAKYRESTSEKGKGLINHVVLNFKQFVKVSKTSYAYTSVSFFADVGAYVALFLGFSFNQIGYYFETIGTWIKHIGK